MSLILQAAYLVISISLTVWVARTLHHNGRIFLLQAFQQDEHMADSVNHLLVVGFYLINIGFVALFLSYGEQAQSWDQAIMYISTKIGVVLLVLGGMHFFNMFNFAKMRTKARRHQREEEDRHARRELGLSPVGVTGIQPSVMTVKAAIAPAMLHPGRAPDFGLLR